MSGPNALVEFVASPTRENFMAVRRVVVGHASYNPYSDDLRELEELFEKEQFDEIRGRAKGLMPNWLLTPSAHLLLAVTSKRLGDEHGEQMEGMLYARCIEGILSTGDGSERQPFLVTRTTDEYDMLQHFGKQMQRQSLRETEHGHFDVLNCNDGSELWFDITDPYRWLMRSMKA